MTPDDPGPAAPGGARARTPDALDLALIEELQHDGRASYASLAKSVGLSEAAARQRVQRLIAGGTMQITAVTDPLTVNLARQAMIGVTADGDTREVARALAEIPEVDYVVLTAGTFDVICEVICEDDEALVELLNQHVRRVPGVRTTETLIYLRLVKQTYAFGRVLGERRAATPG